MLKNILAPDSPQMTTGRMRFACWVPNAANTHSEYVILIAFPLQQWLHERVSLLLYVYTAVSLKINFIGWVMRCVAITSYLLRTYELRATSPLRCSELSKLIVLSPCGFHHVTAPLYVS